ncbi:MAG: hydroxymethylglutaryl-CoA synthase [Rhodospirillaceae bacterium]|nr:hydroxymethylglutaryl-CoA synthase [Rhodospirillaceae bacterium]
MDVGIDHIAFYTPGHFLALDELATVRGVDPKKYTEGIGIREISIASNDEDAVVLAANAADKVIDEAGISRSDIGLLIVGTESAEDKSKPTATHVHELVGIGPNCRVYDIMHACIGATYGVLSALDWVRGAGKGRYALVIASDIARYERESAGEPTQGAGAVAMLICANPRLMALEEVSSFSKSVYDFWKPLEKKYPIVDGMFSAQCYADAATYCFQQETLKKGAAFVFHAPYPKLVQQTYHRIAKLFDDASPKESFLEKVAAGLRYASRVGNIYTGSVWLGLMSVLGEFHERKQEPSITDAYDGCYLFSYGSGCGAVLIRGEFVPGCEQILKKFDVQEQLDARNKVSVGDYERLAEIYERGGSPQEKVSAIKASGPFKFIGVEDEKRIYGSV